MFCVHLYTGDGGAPQVLHGSDQHAGQQEHQAGSPTQTLYLFVRCRFVQPVVKFGYEALRAGLFLPTEAGQLLQPAENLQHGDPPGILVS